MKACIFTLGCKLNEAESASILRGLAERGIEGKTELCAADLYLLNTCAVTAEAERKSRQAVARMRKFNPAAPVVVFGCAAQSRPQTFSEKNGVVFVTGAAHKDAVLQWVDAYLKGEPAPCSDFGPERAFCELPAPMSQKTRTCLRVQDGCDRFCSYCLIPYLRGRSRSRSLGSILEEAQTAASREIVLTGVDLSSWREGDKDLADLVLALKDVPARIRLGSLEVSAVTERLLSAMRSVNAAPHFHLSLQSGSTRVLKAMNRKYTREEYLAACDRIYAAFPDAAVTTDIIVGFPTETEEDFAESLSIVGAAGFSRVHAFPFSAREGTNAARLKDLSAETKRARMERMTKEAVAAEARYLSRMLGTTRTALFEADGGYTENYIRVYHETAEEGGMYEVRLTKPFRDGAACELIRKL